MSYREINGLKLSEPLCDLLERARHTAPGTAEEPIPLSQLIEELLRSAPRLIGLNRAAKIDFGSDSDLPPWKEICTASAAADTTPSDGVSEEVGPKRRRKS